MSYDIIKVLFLDHLRDKIELIEFRNGGNTLFVELKLKKENLLCPVCGSKTLFHDYRPKSINHSVFNNHVSLINYRARRYRCTVCNKRFLEPNPFLKTYETISLLTKMNVLEHLKNHTSTFTSAARRFNISIQSAIDIFDSYVNAKRRVLPEVICLDEFYKSRASKYKYAALSYDFKAKKIIDIITTRHKLYLINYFSRLPKYEKDKVKYFIIDMWEPYRDVIRRSFLKANIAVDSFHVIKDLNEKVRKIRIDVMNKFKENDKSLITNDMYYYMLKKFHYFFVKDFESITNKKIVIPKLRTAWDKHTILDYLLYIDEDLKDVYKLKEEYREFNLTARYDTCDDELNDLIYKFRNHKIESMREFGRTLNNWKVEIKNSFIRINGKRLSNGPVEGVISQIKTLIKSSTDIKNFYRLRNRIMYSINKDIPIKSSPKK